MYIHLPTPSYSAGQKTFSRAGGEKGRGLLCSMTNYTWETFIISTAPPFLRKTRSRDIYPFLLLLHTNGKIKASLFFYDSILVMSPRILL